MEDIAPLMTVAEVAAVLKVHPETIRNALESAGVEFMLAVPG